MKKQHIQLGLAGILLLALTAAAAWRGGLGQRCPGRAGASAAVLGASLGQLPEAEKPPHAPASPWNSETAYAGGDTVLFQGRYYRAGWGTTGDRPGGGSVWEDLGILAGETAQSEGEEQARIDTSLPEDEELAGFKVAGYYPSWTPNKLRTVDFKIVTHVYYAFAIPREDGTLRDLDNPNSAKALIRAAHKKDAKVLLAVGGYSYEEKPLADTFVKATSDPEKLETLVDSILGMCREYGFDGVDMDWETPRVGEDSARQYETLMLALSERLHKEDMLLTTAVMGGVDPGTRTVDRNAAVHTNAVLNAVDFINVMAYDGGRGENHSTYQFAVDAGTYWKEIRGLPAYKVVLGVPFYAQPGEITYAALLTEDSLASRKDQTTCRGQKNYYNGVETVKKKTRYAKENLGGVMAWALTFDTTNKSKSLLQAIGQAAK